MRENAKSRHVACNKIIIIITIIIIIINEYD